MPILYVLEKVKEEQHSSISGVDSTGCTYPHIVIVSYGAIRTDSAKTHIVVVANYTIRTNYTKSYVIVVSDCPILLNSANSTIVVISDGSIIEDLAKAHVIGVANCSVRLNLAKQHIIVVAERLGITRTCHKQEHQYSDNKSILHVAKLLLFSDKTKFKRAKVNQQCLILR